ncbi:MAG: tyrosine-type recombinase/integrase [Deltaproteobacteria bacterium]|nr:tyrosine-type recombinase/integrase [Deltaproteobacteria bacterium]
MGVKVKEHPKGSGEYWLFINHRGKRKSKKIGKDKKFARDMAKKIEAKLTLGDLEMEEFNKKSPSFKTVAEKWLELPHKRCVQTQDAYVSLLEKHIYPAFGKKEIRDIKKKDLSGFFDDLAIKGMSPSTFQNLRSPLSHIFKYAIDKELIEMNPLQGLKLNNKGNIKIRPLEEDEIVILLDKAKQHRGGLFYPHFLTLLRTGMRVGELIGLKWDDIDFEKRTIKIQRTVYNGIVGPTKNRQSRVVDMTPYLTETLKALKLERQKESLKKGRPFSQWIFTFDGRKPMRPLPINYTLDAILKDADLPHMRVHDLRHTYATIRIARGHNIGDVSYQMGHSSIKITFDTYTHWIPSNFKTEVDNLDMHLNASQPHLAKNGDKKT